MASSGYQRLSVRSGGRAQSGPYEGVPDHLRAHLLDWVKSALTRQGGGANAPLIEAVVVRLELPVSIGAHPHDHRYELLNFCEHDPELLLDAIDLLLHVGAGSNTRLSQLLVLGGSVWTIAEDGTSLRRRVSAEDKAMKAAATSPGDAVSEELDTAWGLAFGLKPDPSDAWDHAIKSLEALLIPIIVPNQKKATLGHVVGELRADPSKWTVGLESNGTDTDGHALLGLLQLVWANPDRHQNANARTPTQDEAEKIVKTTVLIINLCRSGHLRKR